MIRVAVVSDSHGEFRNLGRVRSEMGRVDWLIHAGDHLHDAARVATNLGVDVSQVRAVAGNCDLPAREPVHEVVELEGVRILVTHGHHYGVKESLHRLSHRAIEMGVGVVIFGHTHITLKLEKDGILFFNPGSLSMPRNGEAPSCGLLEIERGKVKAQHVHAS